MLATARGWRGCGKWRWRWLRRWRRRWRWRRRTTTDIEELICVAAEEPRDSAVERSGMKVLQDLLVIVRWVPLKDQGRTSSDMGARHRSATEGPGGRIAGMTSREDAAARGPDVGASAIIREGRAAVVRVCGPDRDCRGNKCGREIARVAVVISPSHNHRHTCASGSIHSCAHCGIGAGAAQAHAGHLRTGGVSCHPIQPTGDPRGLAAALIAQNLHTDERGTGRDAVLCAGGAASTMSSMPLDIPGSAAASRVVHSRDGSATEITMGMSDTSVKDEHRYPSAC